MYAQGGPKKITCTEMNKQLSMKKMRFQKKTATSSGMDYTTTRPGVIRDFNKTVTSNGEHNVVHCASSSRLEYEPRRHVNR